MKALLDVLAPESGDYALAKAIDPARVPAHIAVIMDGNGRWARLRNLPRAAGHKAGVPAVRSTVETCAQIGVRVLTLYAFSIENWKRPRAEVQTLWGLLRVYLRRELAALNAALKRCSTLTPSSPVYRKARSSVDRRCKFHRANAAPLYG